MTVDGENLTETDQQLGIRCITKLEPRWSTDNVCKFAFG